MQTTHKSAYCEIGRRRHEHHLAPDLHAARAVKLLRHALAKGFTNIPHLLADADFALLRGRDDCADLLWDIADTPVPAKP